MLCSGVRLVRLYQGPAKPLVGSDVSKCTKQGMLRSCGLVGLVSHHPVYHSHCLLQYNLAYQNAVTFPKAQQSERRPRILPSAMKSAASLDTARTAVPKLRAGRVLTQQECSEPGRYPTLTLTPTQAWHPKAKLPANTQSRAGPMLSTSSSH